MGLDTMVMAASHFFDDDRVTRKQACSLAAMGFKVTVCARKRFNLETPGVGFINIENENQKNDDCGNQSKIELSLIRLRNLKNLLSVYRQRDPDLIISHEYETALLSFFINRIYGTPYVFDCHECYQEKVPEKYGKIVSTILKKIVVYSLKQIAKNAELVTVVSPANKFFFKTLCKNTPIKVLDNAPILEYFPFSEEEACPLTIVHEGSFTIERGAIQIAKALSLVKKHSDIRFLILGTINEKTNSLFMKEVEKLGISDILSMPGRLPWTEFGKIEATGQIGVICSQPNANHYLSLSNKLYTYMACGLAVVGMQGSETQKIIEKYSAGICVDATDPQAIANAILYLIENPETRKTMARNGRRAIEQELGWHCMEKKMAYWYKPIESKLLLKNKSRNESSARLIRNL